MKIQLGCLHLYSSNAKRRCLSFHPLSKMCLAAVAAVLCSPAASSGNVDYSVISVLEEKGLEFACMTQRQDYVAMPTVQRKRGNLTWLTNRIINLSPDGKSLAFVSDRDGKTNIFIKEISKVQGATQRTNRNRILDFNYSPDGTKICFSEDRGSGYQIFVTDATAGFICQQFTSGGDDYSPVFSGDMKTIYFTRNEEQGASIWGCTLNNGMLSSYTPGANPNPIVSAESGTAILCSRTNGEGRGEIWIFDAVKGTEQCVMSDLNHSFSTPMLSPDGKWVVCVGSSDIPLEKPGKFYRNTDIYLLRADGSSIRQLTFHAADDLSPVWSPDGKYIYFISQRGDADGIANVWRIPFNEADYR